MNVIVVDWSGGSFDQYDQAVANTRVVGAVISELVKALHNTTQLDYSNVHLIGHSLGSHICGFAGERIPGLGRITGKDQIAKIVFDHIICDNLYAVDCNVGLAFQTFQCERK